MDIKLLGIYLNDHLAGSRVGLNMARRAARENRGNPVGEFLSMLIPELEEDRAVLMRVMKVLKIPRDTLKDSAAWLAERLGRLKLNGRILRYSPLSRLWELEGLFLGTQGRRSMWRLLRRLARTDRSLSGIDFEALVARTEQHLRGLEKWRLQAADIAFTSARLLPGALSPAESHGR